MERREANHGFGRRGVSGEVVQVRREDVVSPAFHAAIDDMREKAQRDRVSPGRWMIRALLVIVLADRVWALVQGF